MNMKIQLGDYINTNSCVFSGREHGMETRKKLNLNKIDQDLKEWKIDAVIIIIPLDTFSLNTSFFLGLFERSVVALGKYEFRKRYRFDCSHNIANSINADIDQVIKRSNTINNKKRLSIIDKIAMFFLCGKCVRTCKTCYKQSTMDCPNSGLCYDIDTHPHWDCKIRNKN